MAQQQKRAGILANEPVWEHSSTCVQQLPVFKTKHLQNHPLTQLAVGLNPNITAADTLALDTASVARVGPGGVSQVHLFYSLWGRQHLYLR